MVIQFHIRNYKSMVCTYCVYKCAYVYIVHTILKDILPQLKMYIVAQTEVQYQPLVFSCAQFKTRKILSIMRSH